MAKDEKKTAEPQDVALEDVPGHEVLIHPRDLKPSQAMRLFEAINMEDVDNLSMSELTNVVELLEDGFLTDEKAYIEFYRTHGLTAVIELVGAWVGELLGDES